MVPNKARLVAEAAVRQRLEVDRATVRDLAAEIEWSKVSMLTADDYPLALVQLGRTAPAGLAPATAARVIRGYEQAKDAAGVIDFEDVIKAAGGHPARTTGHRESDCQAVPAFRGG